MLHQLLPSYNLFYTSIMYVALYHLTTHLTVVSSCWERQPDSRWGFHARTSWLPVSRLSTSPWRQPLIVQHLDLTKTTFFRRLKVHVFQRTICQFIFVWHLNKSGIYIYLCWSTTWWTAIRFFSLDRWSLQKHKTRHGSRRHWRIWTSWCKVPGAAGIHQGWGCFVIKKSSKKH